MHLPAVVRNLLADLGARQATGSVTLHLHEGVITRYEVCQSAKIYAYERGPVDHGMLVTEGPQEDEG